MSKSAFLALGLCVPLVACGSTTVSPTGTTGSGTTGGTGGAGGTASTGSSAGGAGTGGTAPEVTYAVTFGPVKVAPGDEDTQCMVLSLKNPAIHVGKIRNLLSEGSHHLIVYRTNDTEEKLTPYKCQPFSDLLKPEKGTPLMITQKKEEELKLPQGVAFTLDQNQMIRLEMHYINVTDKDLDVTATSTFVKMPDADFKDEAGFLFLGDPDINLAPHASETLGPIYMPVPPKVAGVNFFGITGHTHQWGTNVKVAVSTGKNGTDTPIYDVPNWQWDEPATVYQDPAFTVPNGGGFRFSCSWNNSSDQTVKFGESATDEMCFFWAYYYPNQGAFVCAHTDQVPGGFDLCCPGPSLCNQIFP